MSLPTLLLNELASVLVQELHTADLGHCLRVDDLTQADGLAICERIREASDSETLALLLTLDPPASPLHALPERVIEFRNRKQHKVCLVVPAGMGDAASSSLGNSFATFPVLDRLRQIADELRKELPDEVGVLLPQIKSQLRGPLAVGEEHWADFVGVVAARPERDVLGRELWRVGLIPDGGQDFVDRIIENRRCVMALVHPDRPNTTSNERLAGLGLTGSLEAKLGDLFRGRRLRESRGWTRLLAEEPYFGTLSFERWKFEDSSESDLTSIDVESFLDSKGVVLAETHLRQPGGEGTQPEAMVGDKGRVTVSWKTTPVKPSELAGWRVAVIPSRRRFGESFDDVGALPVETASASKRRHTLSLEIDPAELGVDTVQIQVVALDQNGREITDAEGRVLEGLTDEFFLVAEDVAVDTAPAVKTRQSTSLPLARLQAVMELEVETLDDEPRQWNDDGLLTSFTVKLAPTRVVEIATSTVLREIESRLLRSEVPIYFEVAVERGETVDLDQAVGAISSFPPGQETDEFASRRRNLLEGISSQGLRGSLSTVRWDAELFTSLSAMTDAYLKVLDQDTGAATVTDSIVMEIGESGRTRKAIVVAPTHPLRLSWLGEYARTVGVLERELARIPREKRGRSLDLDLVERVAPANVPPLMLDGAGNIFCFVSNLRFGWGVYVKLADPDPLATAQDVNVALGLEGEGLADPALLNPSRVWQELVAYRTVHPYVERLRVEAHNAAHGEVLGDALRRLFIASGDDDSTEVQTPSLELDVYERELPSGLPTLEQLQRDLYNSRHQRSGNHLEPLVGISLRNEGDTAADSSHIGILMDQLQPEVILEPMRTRPSMGGISDLLVTTEVADVQLRDGGVAWRDLFEIPSVEESDTIFPRVFEAFMSTLALTISEGQSKTHPGFRLQLQASELEKLDSIHQRCDWVITADRFMPLDVYDSSDQYLGRRYVLDYAPEFLEGFGHQLFVTTSHRDEAESVLVRAMQDLGFVAVEQSVAAVLDHLKVISGRLALRLLGSDAHAREVVGLASVSAYLASRGDLSNAFLVPIDAHPELFGVSARKRRDPGSAARCDLIRVAFVGDTLETTFIEVKARPAVSGALFTRMSEQVEATEAAFRQLFFPEAADSRVDVALQRTRLWSLLRFYARRARRYGLLDDDSLEKRLASVARPHLRWMARRRGYVVNLHADPQEPAFHDGIEIRFITASDIEGTSLSHAG